MEGTACVKAKRQERGKRRTQKRARVQYIGSLLRKVRKGLWFYAAQGWEALGG